MSISSGMAVASEQSTADTAQKDVSIHGKRQAPDANEDEDAASSETAAESPRPAVKHRTLCGVCHTEASRYKCPRCPLAYCSVACSRTHRDNHPPTDDDKPAASSGAGNASVTPTPAPTSNENRHPFSVLDDSAELRRLFAKYPRLTRRLRQICEATQPPSQPSAAPAREEARKRFPWDVAAAQGGNGSPRPDQPWTTEIGLRQGRKALCRARVDPSEDGDGVREYCELVLYLLSGQTGSTGAAGNASSATVGQDTAVAMVKQEVLQGDLSYIKGLLEAEGGR